MAGPGDVVNLAADDVHAAYYCAAEVMRHRQRAGQPVTHWLSAHYARLDAAARVSRSGHEFDGGTEQLEPEKLITAREAATILDLSKRQIHRLAADLDGRIIGGRWVGQLLELRSARWVAAGAELRSMAS